MEMKKVLTNNIQLCDSAQFASKLLQFPSKDWYFLGNCVFPLADVFS